MQCSDDDIKVKRMKLLVEMLDNFWEATYTTAVYYDGSGKHELGRVPSSFGYELVNKSWLPAVTLENKPYSPSLLKGCEIYLGSKKLQSLLHCHVPYLGAKIGNSSFLKQLQIKQDISAKELLDILCMWSQKSSFCTSIDHMFHIYIKLSNSLNEERDSSPASVIDSVFREKELIFVPLITQWRGRPSVDIDGSFVSLDKVVWADRSTVLYNYLKNHTPYPLHLPQILSFFYWISDEKSKGIKKALLNLGVSKEMNLNMLVALLEYNASLFSTPQASQIESFRSIIEAGLHIINSNEQHFGEFFVCKIKTLSVFPSKGKKWVSMNELYIDDDPEISKHFKEVHFLDWPGSNKVDTCTLNSLIELCGLSRVSKSVRNTLVPGAVREFDVLKISFHYMMPLIQRMIVSMDQPHLLSLDFHQRVAQTLIDLRFLSTLELNCHFSLDDKYFANTNIQQCKLNDDDPSKPVIYVVVDTVSKIIDRVSLAPVIYQIIKPDEFTGTFSEKVKSFIQELLINNLQSENDQQFHVDKHQLKDIPLELPEWSVPIPTSVIHKTIEEPTETYTEFEDSEEIVDKVVDKVTTVSNDDTLKAWPPKAPVNPTKSKKQQLFDPENIEQHDRKVTSKDVITSADVQQMVQKGKRKDQVSQGKPNVPQSEQNESRASSSLDNFVSKPVYHDTVLNEEPSLNPLLLPKRENKDSSLNKSNSMAASVKTFSNVTSVDVTSLMQMLPINYDTTLLDFFQSNSESDERNLATGKWGEKFIYCLLRMQGKLPNGIPIKNILWLNEDNETGKPYDIMVTDESNKNYYIEVKSTRSLDMSFIPISWKELEFAREFKDVHFLVRVYGAVCSSPDKVHIKWLASISTHIETNPSVRLFLKI